MTFHCTGWFIGGLITAYQNAHITYNCVILLDFEDKKIDDAIPFLQIAASGTHRKNINSQDKQLPGYPFPFPLDFHLKTQLILNPVTTLEKRLSQKASQNKNPSNHQTPNPQVFHRPPPDKKKTSPNNLKLQNPQLTQHFFRARTWAPTMADRDSPGFFVPSDSWVLEDLSNDGDRWERSRSPT